METTKIIAKRGNENIVIATTNKYSYDEFKMEKTALQFYKDIEGVREKYKLVNGLFIVKYLNDEVSVFAGDFLKSGSALNEGKTNKVKIYSTNQKFNKSKNLCTNAGGDMWRKLNIGFREQDIKEILK